MNEKIMNQEIIDCFTFNRKQLEKQIELSKGPQPTTEREKDIYNLKELRYSIRFGSFYYRSGMMATLDRVIKKLENENDD